MRRNHISASKCLGAWVPWCLSARISLGVKLLVLGGTGGTGRLIVAQALEAGHDVTVLARDRSRVTTTHPLLRVVIGDTTAGADALFEAMRGQDAVISALGRGYSFKSHHLIARSAPNILAAMEMAGLSRLVFTSAIGVGDTFADAPLPAKLFFVTLLRGIYADKLVGDRLIRDSDLDWTIVQPSKMTDVPNAASDEPSVQVGRPSRSPMISCARANDPAPTETP